MIDNICKYNLSLLPKVFNVLPSLYFVLTIYYCCPVLTRPFMSMTTPSRASLADVIILISQENLSERQKQELRSAVRTVARLLDDEPANIAADPAGLRRCLEMIAPEAHGISRGRWANIRSLL